ncbi:unnamed protein product, partial [Didymodactylos carnosus]
ELTPWIPVMAQRLNINFFLLPCCFYDFGGKKFTTKKHENQNDAYLNYVEQICQVLNFDVQRDKLRIPSTKAICFIGRRKNINMTGHSNDHQESISTYNARDQILKHFGIDLDCVTAEKETKQSSLMINKKTILQKTVKSDIALILFKYILQNGSISIPDAYNILPMNLKEQIKSEPGGLNSIIKSYKEIFLLSNNNIHIADPLENDMKQKLSKNGGNDQVMKNLKTKICFFHFYHPDGCPLN